MNTPTLTSTDERRAPWNQIESQEIPFDVIVSQKLVKKDTIVSSDYIGQYEGRDEDGCEIYNVDTSNVDWGKEWDEQALDIPFLLDELKTFVLLELNKIQDNPKEHRDTEGRRKHLESILNACEGWELEETHVEEA